MRVKVYICKVSDPPSATSTKPSPLTASNLGHLHTRPTEFFAGENLKAKLIAIGEVKSL